jgi:hypothetical protein
LSSEPLFTWLAQADAAIAKSIKLESQEASQKGIDLQKKETNDLEVAQ